MTDAPMTDALSIGLLGGGGLLGRAMRRALDEHSFDRVTVFDRSVDLTDRGSLVAAFDGANPTVVINCAAWTDVECAEADPAGAHRVNGDGVHTLATLLAERGAGLIHLSTDYVFSGEKEEPYGPEDRVGPLNEYGRSKRAGEEAILASGLAHWWILRTSWLYGEGSGHFPARMAQLARSRPTLSVVDDQRGTPTSTDALAAAIAGELAEGRGALPGRIEHLAGGGAASWADLAEAVIDLLGDRGDDPLATVERVTTDEFATAQRAAGRTPPQAPRPVNSALDSSAYAARTGRSVVDWRTSLEETFDRYGSTWGEENA